MDLHSCRVWESHSDSSRISRGNYDSEVGSQSSDSRTWERRKAGIAIDGREPEAVYREKDGEVDSLAELWYQVCKKGPRERDGPPTGGPACSLGRNNGHEVNRCPGVGAVHLQQIKTGWPHGANKQVRVKNKGRKLMKSPGNERRSERGVSLSDLWRSSSTDPGGGPSQNKRGRPPWQIQGNHSGRNRWAADRQEFPSLGTQKTAGKDKGSAGPSNTEMDRQPMGLPPPVSRNLDREMRPAKDIRSVQGGNRNARTRGVQETIVTPPFHLWLKALTPGRHRKNNRPNHLIRTMTSTGPLPEPVRVKWKHLGIV